MESEDRSLQQTAQQGANTAATTAGQYGSQAGSIGGMLTPTLERDITNPQGFSPTEQNNMLVQGEQGAGGANAGITGQAGLNAMRTRNTGALSGVLDQASRQKGQQLSQNALGVANESANLAQQKRASALGDLSGLYGTDVHAQLGAMGLTAPDVNAGVNAGNSGWYQNLLGGVNAATGAFKAAFPGGVNGGNGG